jgi:RNA polymerase sigma-70 factor (ECF subfamily)
LRFVCAEKALAAPDEERPEEAIDMSDDGDDRGQASRRFATTHWSLVLAAGDSQSPDSREALTALCQAYWYPVYAHIRHMGHRADEAEDLTQGFFLHLLEKHTLRVARPERGRFRAFLKSSLHNFMSNERTRQQARKRGGGRKLVSLDAGDADTRYRLEPPGGQSPESVFEQRWARVLLSQTLEELRGEMQASGTAERFNRLGPFLTGDSAGRSYAQTASKLDMTEAAVRVAVHRMRRRFGELLRRVVSQTVNDPAEVDDEIRFLFSAIDGKEAGGV